MRTAVLFSYSNSRCSEEGASLRYPRLERALVGPLLKPASKRDELLK